MDAAYTHIELTPYERSKALHDVRQAKHFALESQQFAEKKRAFYAEIDRPWNAEELKAFVLTQATVRLGYSQNNGYDGKPVYKLDEQNTEVINILSAYFTNDPVFETMGEGYTLSKGLLLAGNVGLGKTDIMRLFSGNKRKSFIVISCRKVADLYQHSGDETIEAFSGVRHEVAGDTRVFNQRHLGYCFDDLGIENLKNNYGNKLNVFEAILQNRYDRKHNIPFWFTHMTTNLTAGEIEERYGTRVRSRMREMFNTIQLKGKDRRG